jgi:signal transduction histidine kinase
VNPLHDKRPRLAPPPSPERTGEPAFARTLELASRLVREQERRVTHFKAATVERGTAEALLATLRASLALCQRYRGAIDDSERIQLPPLPSEHDAQAAPPASPTNGGDQTVREEERKRIAQELHDDLGQQLSALEFSAKRVERLAGVARRNHPLGTAIRDLQAQIDCALTSVKRMTQQLRPLALETLGFPAAIEWLAAEFGNRSNVQLACRFRAVGFDVSEPAATAIFRIVQEALTNVARHACARSVTIDFYRDRGACVLRIADDGVGKKSNGDARSPQSLGLSGMAERAAQFRGTLSIHTSEGAGFAIVVRLPLSAIASNP